MNLEVTEEEFELLCMAVGGMVYSFKEKPTHSLYEEDEAIENVYLVKFLDLQEKFPEPGPFSAENIDSQ